MMYYTRNQTESEFVEWLDSVCITDVLSYRSPAYLKREQLERLLHKEKRLEQLIKNKQRAKRRKAARLATSQLDTKEVGEWLKNRLT